MLLLHTSPLRTHQSHHLRVLIYHTHLLDFMATDFVKQSMKADTAAITKPGLSDALNVDEYASAPSQQGSGERWGFPRLEGQSLSYWLQQVRCDELVDHRTTQDLPKSADVVVVGSGVSARKSAMKEWSADLMWYR